MDRAQHDQDVRRFTQSASLSGDGRSNQPAGRVVDKGLVGAQGNPFAGAFERDSVVQVGGEARHRKESATCGLRALLVGRGCGVGRFVMVMRWAGFGHMRFRRM